MRCYIEGIMKRAGKEPFDGPIRTKPATWKKPIAWDKKASEVGERRRVFTCSMSDFFHPGADAWRPEAWALIKACPHLDWLILTKRPELIIDRLPADWGDGYPNVWLGVTAGAMSSIGRVELLKEIPAAIRFVSAEPLVERMDFRPHLDGRIHWIITGCESAAEGKRRPMDVNWVRDVDEQCRDADVAHYYKQYYAPGTNTLMYDGVLDGEVRQAFPRPRDYKGQSE